MKRLAVAILLLVGLWVVTSRLQRSRTYQLFGSFITAVDTPDSVVAFTFDDGPTVWTDTVLSVLADVNATATFFAVGEAMERHPDVTRRIVQGGHELANHSFTHVPMVFKTPGFVRDELARTDSLIRAAGHQGPIHFRPPFGRRLASLPWVLARQNRPAILWDLEPESYPDVIASPQGVVDHVLSMVRPGSILLFHPEPDPHTVRRQALRPLIEALRARGYRMVTLGQLLEGASSGVDE